MFDSPWPHAISILFPKHSSRKLNLVGGEEASGFVRSNWSGIICLALAGCPTVRYLCKGPRKPNTKRRLDLQMEQHESGVSSDETKYKSKQCLRGERLNQPAPVFLDNIDIHGER